MENKIKEMQQEQKDKIKRLKEMRKLRAKRWTYREIGERFGITAQAAHYLINNYFGEVQKEGQEKEDGQETED